MEYFIYKSCSILKQHYNRRQKNIVDKISILNQHSWS
jgi:hypothetical protein